MLSAQEKSVRLDYVFFSLLAFLCLVSPFILFFSVVFVGNLLIKTIIFLLCAICFTAFNVMLYSIVVSAQNKEKDKLPIELLYQALDFSCEHIIITDVEGTILFANEMVEKMTGFNISEIIGKKAGSKQLWGGQMDGKFYKKMWNTIGSGHKYDGVLTNKRKDEELYEAQVSIFPVKIDNRVCYYIGIERNLSLDKELDRMKTDFISLASHQLRTPLSAMKWYLEMLLDGDAGELNDEQKSFIGNINNSNERMIELVNSLLNISRVESGRLIVDPKPTNLIEVIEDVVSDVKPKAKERGLTFIVEEVPSLPTIISDPKLIRNVYMNLLSNAIKYTPSGGPVMLKVSTTKTDVVNEISDTGLGIPKKDQDKIFTRFFRAEDARAKVTDGNGLGLYLVKSVVEVCGGKIWFKSNEGSGSTFTFTLPLRGILAKKGEVTIDT